MTRRRRPARRRLLGRIRNLAQGWVWVAVVVGVVGLVTSSLQTHRLDSLRVQRVELVEELDLARHDLERARRGYEREASYEVVAERARHELGLVESAPGEQLFLALPETGRRFEPETAWDRLAQKLDRFGSVRRALAREEER